MVGNTIKSEISGIYEFVRDLLWFSNWMILNNLDTKERGISCQPSDEYCLYHENDRKYMKERDVLLSSLLSMKISTHSLLLNQKNLNENLKFALFSKSEVNKNIGFNDVMPFFIARFYTNIVSSELESISSMQDIFSTITDNFFRIGAVMPEEAPSTFIPLIIQQLINMKEYYIVEKAVGCLKVKSPALSFALAVSKAQKGETEQFIKYFCQGITSISSQNPDSNAIIKEQIFSKNENDVEFLEIVKNCNNPALIFVNNYF